MRKIFLACLIALCALSASAQDMQPIEQRMTAEARKAAGIDKLSADELGALNAWLEANMSEKAIRKSLVGFPVMHLFSGGDQAEPIVAHIVGEFRGWSGRTSFTLDNGQVWEQIEPGSLVARRMTNPAVTIKPAMMGTWMLRVEGYNRSVRVQRTK